MFYFYFANPAQETEEAQNFIEAFQYLILVYMESF